jgi:hypothetical protein
MEIPHAGQGIDDFVLALLRTGYMLSGLAADLVEALPADAYPGEDTAAVVIEMICGTIATALESADPGAVRQATELIELASTRTVEHLRLTYAMSRRMRGADRPRGRTYG